MIGCCKTKQELWCVHVSVDRLVSVGRARSLSNRRSCDNTAKTACCLFSYLKVRITTNSGLAVLL